MSLGHLDKSKTVQRFIDSFAHRNLTLIYALYIILNRASHLPFHVEVSIIPDYSHAIPLYTRLKTTSRNFTLSNRLPSLDLQEAQSSFLFDPIFFLYKEKEFSHLYHLQKQPVNNYLDLILQVQLLVFLDPYMKSFFSPNAHPFYNPPFHHLHLFHQINQQFKSNFENKVNQLILAQFNLFETIEHSHLFSFFYVPQKYFKLFQR